jgi:Glyoxalase-like domain
VRASVWAARRRRRRPDGVAPQIFLQEVPEPKVVKNRIHLDLRVGGGLEVPVALRRQRVEAEVDRLIRAGATRLRTSDQEVADASSW